MRPDRYAGGVRRLSPFHLFDDFGIGFSDQLAHAREQIAPPVAKLLDFRIDEFRGLVQVPDTPYPQRLRTSFTTTAIQGGFDTTCWRPPASSGRICSSSS